MKLILLPVAISIALAALSPSVVHPAGVQDDIDRAASMFEQFQAGPTPTIPKLVLRNAKGLAFLTVFELAPQLRAGLQLSGRGSKGIVVARTGKGWSGPSAVASGSAGYGAQMKEQLGEFILVLNNNDALSAFSSGENVRLGTDVTVAAGPRSVIVGSTPSADVYYYQRSEDPNVRSSLQGIVVAVNDEENRLYYGDGITARNILSGQATPPGGVRRLREVLFGF